MYLCACQPLWFSAATESPVSLASASSLLSLLALLTSAHRMCLTRIVRRACSVLWFPGQLLLLCVALDTVFLACLYDTAVLPDLPENSSASSAVNLSSEYTLSTSSLSSSPQLSQPPHAALLSSSSSSSSLVDSETNSSYDSSNKTETFPLDPQHISTNGSHGPASAKSNHNSKENKSGSSSSSSSSNPHGNSKSHNQAVSSYHAGKASREFPFALVVASSTAAVSILLFFCLSYIWHTRQLDRRAQKLAIRLAAESEAEVNCSQCRTPTTYMAGSSQDSGTDSGGEEVMPATPAPRPMLEELNSVNEEDEDEAEAEGEAEDGSRRKPGGVGRTLGSRRGRRGRRSGSRSSRKWSGHSGGAGRSSMVTDQEILSHFASRRHSTFFI